MKRLLITLSTVLIFAGCGSTIASAAEPVKHNSIKETTVTAIDLSPDKVPDSIVSPEIIAEMQAQLKKYQNYNKKMKSAVNELKKYVGWDYGYGETPGAWDCSGLVRWFYKQLGVDVYHSATVQYHSGTVVKTPIVGDVVAFHYFGSGDYSFHTGIYIGNGLVLHAYNSRVGTVITTVEEVEKGNYAYATYTRIINPPVKP